MSETARSRWLASAVAMGLAAALAIPAPGAHAAPSGPAPTVVPRADGSSRVVVPFREQIRVRDAAPLVMSGDTPLGVGRISADRRAVVLDTRAGVDPARVRVAWSGGGIPAPRGARPNAARPRATAGAAVLPPGVRTVPPEQLATGLTDPGVPGHLAVARASYTLGDTALRVPTGYRVEVTGEVTYPVRLRTRRPLVVLLHGRHAFCGRTGGELGFNWPCDPGYRRIPSEQGYRGLADLLASHGMVVVSVAANGINAQDDAAADGGAVDRGYLVMHHLRLWRGWATTVRNGPFGTRFRGKLDFTRVGLMGHSRGGEGVVAALTENHRAVNRFGIRAVLPLAPVDFNRYPLRGTASLTVVPYCDGDVSDLQGVHFFDDATTGQVDRASHALLGVFGANHNFFNTIWTPGGWEAGAFDDWSDAPNRFCGSSSGRLTPAQQSAAGNAYMAAFFRARLQGRTGYDRLFLGNTATPASASPAKTVASWSAPAGRRLLVNDLRASTTNALGGATTATGFDAAIRCGGNTRYALTCMPPRGPGDEPHLGANFSVPGALGLAQMHLVWSRAGAAWSNAVPSAYGDVSRYRYATLRIARDAWALSAAPPVLCLQLQDTTGTAHTVRLSGPALTTPVFTDRNTDQFSSVPHALVISVPVRLSAFYGVDLRRVRSVSLLAFGGSGDMTVGDVSFQR